jgi:hypothetical protein
MRPISLCNFSNEIITKLLNARLSGLLPSLISQEQSGFVKGKGRNIHDNILLAYELVQHIDDNKEHDNVILKLDMTKAYDRLSCIFLIRIKRQFGFAETFIDMIWRILSNNWYSVLINGKPEGYFTSEA